ncbi:LacI family gluconate utilization system Gnt-I transcriptional repressor [Rhodobium orientis]|nr:LacI family gluconate utilization system Gnt-I transcriptional repressor [Rhodobium orientis]
MAGMPTKKIENSDGRLRHTARSVTLESVARLAGVAPTTVSRALNHPEKVAAKTLSRIQDAIASTGYVPNLLAGGLASSRSRLIAAIVPSIANLVYAETIQSFTRRVRESGYQVFLGETGYDPDAEEELVVTVLSRRPDAIFLTGIHHSATCRQRLLAAGIPIVETWDITPTPLDIAVGFSHSRVGHSVAAYLHDRGHRTFGVASADDPRARLRNRAFTAELAERGIDKVETSYLSPVSSLELGRRALADLLAATLTPIAVFCSSDTVAQGVLVEAQARGLASPEDVAIVGFGDQNFAAFTYPALTTVKIDRVTIGERSAEALLARLDDEPVEENVVDVGFEIIARQTA